MLLVSLVNLAWDRSGSVHAILSNLGELDHNSIAASLILRWYSCRMADLLHGTTLVASNLRTTCVSGLDPYVAAFFASLSALSFPKMTMPI